MLRGPCQGSLNGREVIVVLVELSGNLFSCDAGESVSREMSH